MRVTEPDRTCLKVWMLSRWVRDYITTTETSQYSLCCGLKKRRLTSLQTVTLWHSGLIVSRRLYFIKWRAGGSLVTPTIFPCWYVWSQQDFGVTQAWTLTLTQVKAWFHGVLWHWTMSHLCPVQSVSAVRAEAISRAGTTERYSKKKTLCHLFWNRLREGCERWQRCIRRYQNWWSNCR